MLSPTEQETATLTLVDRLWSTRRLQPLARLAHDRLNSFFNFDIISQFPPEVLSLTHTHTRTSLEPSH